MNYVKYKNILKSLFSIKTSKAIINKITDRFDERNSKNAMIEAKKWCEEVSIDIHDYLNSLPKEIIDDANKFNKVLKEREKQVQPSVPFKMGAGGNCTLIYCLTRHVKAKTVVETGVSMGYSSFAFLQALKENGGGHLYSSDLPYFDHPDSDKFVGCMIPDDYKKEWKLYSNGDKSNFPKMAKEINTIDVFNYDSAKSYASREYAWNFFKSSLKKGSVVMFDDILDNLHFRDLVLKEELDYKVLKGFTGNYVGLIYL